MFNPPTLEDLQRTRRANEKLVLEALDSKPEWVETELAKTTGLALSHLRAALASLLDQGRVRRLPGTGTRAVYGLADPGLANVPATPLTETAMRIQEYLKGRADSAFNMGNELKLEREAIIEALSLLNAHGLITCTFVGSLVIFRLKEKEDLNTEKAAQAAEEEAGKAASKSKPAAKKSASKKASAGKAKADEPKAAQSGADSSKLDTGEAASRKSSEKVATQQASAKTAPAKKAAATQAKATKKKAVSLDSEDEVKGEQKASAKKQTRKRVTKAKN